VSKGTHTLANILKANELMYSQRNVVKLMLDFDPQDVETFTTEIATGIVTSSNVMA
jgi:hypothetical protein